MKFQVEEQKKVVIILSHGLCSIQKLVFPFLGLSFGIILYQYNKIMHDNNIVVCLDLTVCDTLNQWRSYFQTNGDICHFKFLEKKKKS